ncbi:transglutaminaseTgpA domain-containing protein [Microcella sp.]|uniref:transglutaminase family protein n=1 Tax=Microcella sp. TaxID=1913979 RepID=UPI00391D2842
MSARVRAARPAPTAWWLSVAVLVSVGAALSALSVVLGDGDWFVPTMVTAAIGVAVAAVVRRAVPVWRGFWSVVAGGAALFAAVVVQFAADTALLGVVPLPETFLRLSLLIREGELSIVEQAVPAFADDGIRFLLAAGVGALAVLSDALVAATRRPALLAAPLLALVAIPVIVAPGALPLVSVLATAAAFLVVLALHRPAAVGGAGGVSRLVAAVSAALVAAVVVPGLLPTAVVGDNPAGTGPASLVTGVNPVLELGNDLRRASPVEALRYSTDAEGGVYLTLSHLAEFAGQQVLPVEFDAPAVPLSELAPPTWLPDELATGTLDTRIDLRTLRTQWLPLPQAPEAVSGVGGNWVIDPAGTTVRAESGVARDLSYTVRSLVAQPTTEQLRAATAGGDGLEQFLQIPEGLDPSIPEAAREATAEARTPYEQAIALQRFFTGGQFAYSEDAPVEGGYDGSGADIVAQFLVERSGYCVHFASAMALMARTLDIPSRIAVGFLPGARNPQVPTEFIVSSDNLHAWPELHFDGLGWVRFEPTPSLGVLPDYATDDILIGDEAPLPDGETPAPEPSDAVDPANPDGETDPADPASPDGDADAGGPDGIPDLVDGGDEAGGSGEGRVLTDPVLRSTLIVAVLVALAVALVATPALWRQARRRRRMRSTDPLIVWREVRDTARDLGRAAEPTRTVRELGARWGVDVALVAPLVTALEARAYAGPQGEGVIAPSVKPLIAALRAATPWWRRVLAVIAPLSLIDREPDDARVLVTTP